MSRDEFINLSNSRKIPLNSNAYSVIASPAAAGRGNPVETQQPCSRGIASSSCWPPRNDNNPCEIALFSPLRKWENKHLEQSILSTIVYYDCLDYPLTIVEIFRYLVCSDSNYRESPFHCHPEGKTRRIPWNKKRDSSSVCRRTQNDSKKKFRLIDILESLETSETLKKNISRKNGFYFLRGRENIVEKRIWRKKLADEKWKKLKPTLLLCQMIPYIRAVFVSGSLALGNTKKESDIDILVIAEHGHIWTARAFLTVFLSILGKYRQTNSTEDKICANHYITDRSLAIPFPSLYNAQTYAHFFAADPLSNKIMKEFKKSNGWIASYLLHFDPDEDKNMHNETVKKPLRLSLYAAIKKILETILNPTAGAYLENKFRIFESGRIKKSGLYNKSGGRITISDEQLEFHPDSPEKIIVEKFNAKMRDLDFPELANLKDSGLN